MVCPVLFCHPVRPEPRAARQGAVAFQLTGHGEKKLLTFSWAAPS